MPIAKLWVNHVSMETDPSKHIAYLTNGHQLSTGEQAQVWTKSIPKDCKTDLRALIAHWRGIFDRFLEERATPGSMIHHNATVTARQFVINLPNCISPAQINDLAKAVLRDFPRHLPVTMVLHKTSNRGKQHLHLQGLFSYRNGGYGSIQEPFRLGITKQMKETVTLELVKSGYTVDAGKQSGISASGISASERRWLRAQGTVEQRRSPRYMMKLSAIATSPKLQNYCREQATRMLDRMGVPASEFPPLNTMNTMELLQSTCLPEKQSLQDRPSSNQPHGSVQPLTQDELQKELIKARRWKHTKTISRNFRS
jgi:hypothetical protein